MNLVEISDKGIIILGWILIGLVISSLLFTWIDTIPSILKAICGFLKRKKEVKLSDPKVKSAVLISKENKLIEDNKNKNKSLKNIKNIKNIKNRDEKNIKNKNEKDKNDQSEGLDRNPITDRNKQIIL